jgi:hypothetical protein
MAIFAVPMFTADDARPSAVSAATPAAWSADQQKAFDAGMKQAQATEAQAPKPIDWVGTGLAALTVLGVVLGVVGRFAPQANAASNILQAGVTVLKKAITPAHVQEAERQQLAWAQAGTTMFNVLNEVSNNMTVGDLKAKLGDRWPALALTIVNQSLEEMKKPT